MGHESTFDRRQLLAAMLSHAAQHSPYYREQEWASRLRAGTRIHFHDIPTTPGSLVKAETEKFFASFVPPGDGRVHDKHTSGTSGEPLLVRKTDRHFQVNALENRRLEKGWGSDRHLRSVHVANPNAGSPIGKIEEEERPGGRRSWKFFTPDTSAALDFLARTSATWVVAFPSIMLGVLEQRREIAQSLPLQLISTYSEVVSDELRQLVREIPDCKLMDTYGCIEAGLIALGCPDCGAYHPADRHLILEILADDGRVAKPGEMGRVIVTPLFSRAMPFVRYETGDYAILAERNGCPRSPHAIARIIGREKNLFKLPDGRKITPTLPSTVALDLGFRQYKLIQTTLSDIELRYIPRSEGTELAPEVAQNIVDLYLSPGFKVSAVRVSDIPRSPGGKFLMHESLV